MLVRSPSGLEDLKDRGQQRPVPPAAVWEEEQEKQLPHHT